VRPPLVRTARSDASTTGRSTVAVGSKRGGFLLTAASCQTGVDDPTSVEVSTGPHFSSKLEYSGTANTGWTAQRSGNSWIDNSVSPIGAVVSISVKAAVGKVSECHAESADRRRTAEHAQEEEAFGFTERVGEPDWSAVSGVRPTIDGPDLAHVVPVEGR